MRISDWSSDVCSSDLARRRNARMQRIAADDRGRGVAPFGQPVAVDQHFAGLEPQRLDRASHREEGRLQDVDPVDLLDARLADAPAAARLDQGLQFRSEEHTSELQSLMRISYAVFCLKKKKNNKRQKSTHTTNNT